MSEAKQSPQRRILDLVDWSQNERENGSKSYEEILLTVERRAAAIGMGITVCALNQARSDTYKHQPLLFGAGLPEIVACVAKGYGMTVEQMTSPRRTKNLSYARHIAMYICRTRTDAVLVEIGRHFNRDHSSVLHAIGKIEGVILKDHRVARDIELINAVLDEMAEKRNHDFMDRFAESEVSA